MYAKYFKRLFDFCFSLLGLILLLPIMAVLTVTGAAAMKGNPFFLQKRPGRKDKNGNEKIFNLIKFRTMTCEKDKNGNLLPDELRLNKYGYFLRATSLDELPELICIVRGDMSLIGPRPLLPKYLDRFTDEQRHRHDVRPGLTGLAQINGRNALSWEDRFKLDLEYVSNVTFSGDLKIFFQTIFKVLKREGISSDVSATMEEFMGTVDLHGAK